MTEVKTAANSSYSKSILRQKVSSTSIEPTKANRFETENISQQTGENVNGNWKFGSSRMIELSVSCSKVVYILNLF